VGLLRNRGISEDQRARLPSCRRLVCDYRVLHAGSAPYRWKRLGYSNTADPWKEERYGF